jgi:hypothetical protein
VNKKLKKMKTINSLLLALLLVFIWGGANAQNAGSIGIGARLSPDGGGFTAKFFADRNFAIELQLNGSGGYFSTADEGPSVVAVGLLEYNIIFPDPSWRIFLGPGLHAGTWERYNNRFNDYNRTSQGIVGMDGIFGVEYIFKSIPIGLSADVKPAMNFAPDVVFFPNNFLGLSARYYFGHKPMHSKMHRAPDNG